MNAQSPALLRRNAAEFFGVCQVPGGAESHGVGKHCGSEKTSRQHTSFKVSGDQERELRFLLQLVEQCDRLVSTVKIVGPSLGRHRHSERTNMIFPDVIPEFEVMGTPTIQELHPQADHEELPDLLFERKPL